MWFTYTQGSVEAEVPGTTDSGDEEGKQEEESPEYRENLIRVVRAAGVKKARLSIISATEHTRVTDSSAEIVRGWQANSVKALDKLFLPVNFRSVTEIFKLSKSLNSSLTDMLEPHFHEKVVEQELQQRLEDHEK